LAPDFGDPPAEPPDVPDLALAEAEDAPLLCPADDPVLDDPALEDPADDWFAVGPSFDRLCAIPLGRQRFCDDPESGEPFDWLAEESDPFNRVSASWNITGSFVIGMSPRSMYLFTNASR